MLVFAQISDTHLDGGDHRAERAARVMAHLDGLPLDAVLVTGDVADHGEAAEYEQAVEALASRHRVLACPGNHDARAPYRTGLLGEPPSDDPIDRAHTVAGTVFAMCDSTIPGRGDGFLADETLAWLDERLAADPDAPAFVCFHHPPVPVGIPYVDEIRQSGEERLAAVVERHPQVVALLCGHAHTAAATTFAGRPLLVAPGVVSTLRLPGEAGAVADETAPPGFALHVLDDDGRLTTHFRTV
ncbi:metallophosphoesterase [Actinomadura decatromicini]|uniref:Phosphodiesterase n=1 Tax=Actinomadura decatromicini TaxID=2604572 RepID=A0A5D3FAZ0_9ACTN|nr:metallophosphoesterase [Actinomadura decatromicini]TYK45383.1 phosphodiesterase [Actinomadura decatromicini]